MLAGRVRGGLRSAGAGAGVRARVFSTAEDRLDEWTTKATKEVRCRALPHHAMPCHGGLQRQHYRAHSAGAGEATTTTTDAAASLAAAAAILAPPPHLPFASPHHPAQGQGASRLGLAGEHHRGAAIHGR